MDNEMNNFMQMNEDMFEDDFDRDEPDEELPTQSADRDEDEDFPVQSVEDLFADDLDVEQQGVYEISEDGLPVDKWEEKYQEEKDLPDELSEEQKAENEKAVLFPPDKENGFIVSTPPSPEVIEILSMYIDSHKLVFEEVEKEMEKREKRPIVRHYDESIEQKYDEIRELEEKIKNLNDKIVVEEENDPNGEEIQKLFKEKEELENKTVSLNNEIKSIAVKKMNLPKSSFAKPKEEKGFGHKVRITAVVCAIISLFFAVQSISYTNFCVAEKKETPSAMGAAFGWLTEADVPFDLSITDKSLSNGLTTFFIILVVSAIIAAIALASADTKKKSRVGHEHGNARLGTNKDFQKFKNTFMDMESQKKPNPMMTDPDYIDNNMLFGMKNGEYLALSLNNKKVNRSANVLVIGGTGTGKTFKYIKPNILQENCSMIITDPSGDIFRSFAPYLLSRGYNVYLFNASDFTLSNHYNPLLNVYDSNGNISETQVDVLVDLYMKNAKAGKEAGGGDPFWDKSEKAFMTAIIYYVLESDEFGTDGSKVEEDGTQWDKCFSTVLKLVQQAKVDDETDEDSPLTQRMNAWFKEMDRIGKPYKCKQYYDTFLIAPQKTANTILITTAVDLQIFSTFEVDRITRLDYEHSQMNIDIDKIATQQSYLFLGIPQSHQAYNFLIAMLYSQLYSRLYELGERKLRGKYHIGYRAGTPVFDYFDSFEEALDFFNHITKDDIEEVGYINSQKMYNIMYKNKCYKSSVLKEPLEKFIEDIDAGKMIIWAGDEFAGGDPALPIHVNFLLDEFKNIGEIPNFLTILSTSRKYRIGSHVVIQDIGQLKTLYKENEHETLLANVDTTIFLGSILQEDKETIQKMLGKTTIRQKSTSSSNSGLSTSYTPTEVDLMSIDQIAAINQNGRDDEIVIIRDTTPYVCRKLLLTEHRRWCKVQEVKKKGINAENFYRNNNENDLYKN